MSRKSAKRQRRGGLIRQHMQATEHRTPCGIPSIVPGVCESLEGRVLLSKATVVDAGDYYWGYYPSVRQVPFLRATDNIVVEFIPSSARRINRLVAGITGPQGALAGYQLRQQLDSTTYVLQRTARGQSPQYATLLELTRGFPALKYVAPTFRDPTTLGMAVLTDEIEIDLVDGADAARFFGAAYSSYRPAPIGTNAFIATLAVGGGTDVLRTSIELHNHSQVEHAIPADWSEIIAARFVPDDTYYSWTASPGYGQWNMDRAQLPEAWDDETGAGTDIVIAVLDNGVDKLHPDLDIFTNIDEVNGGTSQDLDGNGYAHDIHGWDFFDTSLAPNQVGDNDPSPDPNNSLDDHGTTVAGIAGAIGDNAVGVSGAAPHAKIMPVRVFHKDPGGQGTNAAELADYSRLAAAFRYAAGLNAQGNSVWRGADVINGCWSRAIANDTLSQSIDWAATRGRGGLGMPIFMSAGNEGQNTNPAYRVVQYPASLSNVIAVGASTYNPNTQCVGWAYSPTVLAGDAELFSTRAI